MKPYEIERFVRNKLEEMFGSRFRKAKLVVGYDRQKRPQIHEFDAVSEKMDIIGEIKSGKSTRKNFNSALVDCFYLNRVHARTKLIVFTDEKLYEYFKSKSEGLIHNEILAILIAPESSSKPMVSQLL